MGVRGMGLLGRSDAGPSSILRSAGVTSARDFGGRDYTHRAVCNGGETDVAGTYGFGREDIGARQAYGETCSSAAELLDRTAANVANRMQHGSRMAAFMAQTVSRFGAHTLGGSTTTGTAARHGQSTSLLSTGTVVVAEGGGSFGASVPHWTHFYCAGKEVGRLYDT